jgi:hypothetical protein
MELTVEHLKVVEYGKTIVMKYVETSTRATLLDTCCIVSCLNFATALYSCF